MIKPNHVVMGECSLCFRCIRRCDWWTIHQGNAKVCISCDTRIYTEKQEAEAEERKPNSKWTRIKDNNFRRKYGEFKDNVVYGHINLSKGKTDGRTKTV